MKLYKTNTCNTSSQKHSRDSAQPPLSRCHISSSSQQPPLFIVWYISYTTEGSHSDDDPCGTGHTSSMNHLQTAAVYPRDMSHFYHLQDLTTYLVHVLRREQYLATEFDRDFDKEQTAVALAIKPTTIDCLYKLSEVTHACTHSSN